MVASLKPLAGMTVVVTRPRERAEATGRALESAGARVIVIPLLEIAALDAPDVGLAAPPDVIIFVSRYAADFGVRQLSQQRLIANRQSGQDIYAVGRATAIRLAALGIGNAKTPLAGEDSEALLAELTLQKPMGASILIVQGESTAGGRPLLSETLAARGASVSVLSCYRRAPRQLDAAEFSALVDALQRGAALLIGSIETLDALLANIEDGATANRRGALAGVALVLVPHPRVAAAATLAGAPRVSVVSLEDNKLVESLSNLQA